jgi:hypothetical protein
MRAIVGGRRDIAIPTGGRDEIAEMARGLEVFRGNASSPKRAMPPTQPTKPNRASSPA